MNFREWGTQEELEGWGKSYKYSTYLGNSTKKIFLKENLKHSKIFLIRDIEQMCVCVWGGHRNKCYF